MATPGGNPEIIYLDPKQNPRNIATDKARKDAARRQLEGLKKHIPVNVADDWNYQRQVKEAESILGIPADQSWLKIGFDYGTAGNPNATPAEKAAEAVGSFEYGANKAIQTAQQTTQDRAAADRAAALAAIDAARTQSLAGYAPTEATFAQLQGSPESIDDATAAAMYAKARTGIQAGTQNIQRGLERSFAQRGMTGSGLAINAAAQAGATGVGQQAGVQRDIGIQRALQRRTDLLNILGVGASLAGAKAGIIQNTAGAQAGVLGNTITAVPDIYSDPEAYKRYVAAIDQMGQPTVPTTGGGGFGGTVTTGTGGGFRIPPMAPAGTGAAIRKTLVSAVSQTINGQSVTTNYYSDGTSEQINNGPALNPQFGSDSRLPALPTPPAPVSDPFAKMYVPASGSIYRTPTAPFRPPTAPFRPPTAPFRPPPAVDRIKPASRTRIN